MQGDDSGWRPLVAVFVGGCVGTALRLSLDAVLPHGDVGFPLSTLLINVLGSFVLGYLVSAVWPVAPAWARAGFGPGLLGGFTTFSALMVSLVSLTAADRTVTALLYLALTLLLGFCAAAAGLVIGRPRAPGQPVQPVNKNAGGPDER